MATSSFSYKKYVESDDVKKAKSALDTALANKPGAYKSAWQTQLNDTLGKIQNREPFKYDVNADALYQQYKDRYVQQGRQAMMDTMGQAAALTGGYGNSYAQTVGQQTYQGYLQGLNDKIPELYQLARDAYDADTANLYNMYSLYSDRENTDYGRYRDTVGDWENNRNYYTDVYNNARTYDYGMYSDDRGLAYKAYADAVAQDQWQKEFDEAVRKFNFANGLGEFAVPASSGGSGGGKSPKKKKTNPVDLVVAGSNFTGNNYYNAALQRAALGQITSNDIDKYKGNGMMSDDEAKSAKAMLNASGRNTASKTQAAINAYLSAAEKYKKKK